MPNQTNPQPKPKLTQNDIELQRRGYKQGYNNVDEMIKKLAERFRVAEPKTRKEPVKIETMSSEQFLKSFLKV